MAMGINMVWLIGSFGGGALGAVMGPLPAITLWGLILVGAGVAGVVSGDGALVWNLGFNPIFGAHIVYASGAGALAYAARRGYIESGLNILQPLAGLGKPDVLLVGGVFGVLGYLAERIGTGLAIPTDNVALSVVVTGLIARIVFDPKWLKNRHQGVEEKPKSWPSGQQILMMVVLGATVSIAGSLSAMIVKNPLIPFGLALMFIIYLQMGFKGEVWHHVILIAAITSLQGGGSPAAMFWGVVLGTVAAVVSACLSKLWIEGTNSYIDPPVTSIAICTSLMQLLNYLGAF